MKQGTISVMFGCHSFIHSIMVLISWRKLYGEFPKPWQIICIFLHDIGHWGKNYLDNYEEKKHHALLGAEVSKRLFGQKGYDLVVGHNPYNGDPRSDLFNPDKYSWIIAPLWWMITNTWFEPKLQRRGSSRRESAVMFKDAMRVNWENGLKEQGHDIYLRQWGHSQEVK